MFVIVSPGANLVALGANLVASGSFLNAAWLAFCPPSSIPWTRCVNSAQSDGRVLLLRTGAPQSPQRCHSLCDRDGASGVPASAWASGGGGGLTALGLVKSL